ncbi:MAG: hypothetical protein FJ028_09165 [Chloroflexi bacterium]|nr:hypothetical protein [Chloroflexota bacterium]
MEAALPSGLMALAIVLIFASICVGQGLDPAQARLRRIAARPRTLEELELRRPISERTLKPIIQMLSRLVGRFCPANTVRGLAVSLKRAGTEGTSTEFFLGVKAFAALVGAVGGPALVNAITADPTQTLIAIPAGLVLGFKAPDFYLSNKAGKRAGESRQESLRGIVERVEQKELQNFISAKVLRMQSEQLRQERRQRSEERAAKAPVMIMLPAIGRIFPSLFTVILGPAALQAMDSCAGI